MLDVKERRDLQMEVDDPDHLQEAIEVSVRVRACTRVRAPSCPALPRPLFSLPHALLLSTTLRDLGPGARAQTTSPLQNAAPRLDPPPSARLSNS
jgi:hypothetical protein